MGSIDINLNYKENTNKKIVKDDLKNFITNF